MTGRSEVEDARERTAAMIAGIRADLERRSGLLGSIDRAGLESALVEVRRKATINAHWGIAPSWPIFGSVEVLVKRAMRILLRWYINPIVEQQNEYNLAVLGTLYELEAQLQEIALQVTQESSQNDQGDSR